MSELSFLRSQGIGSVHCVGIGGIGVSGLADILLQAGFAVSGSDSNESSTIARLRTLGGRIHTPHAISFIEAADCVIYSRAIAPDNPELMFAMTKGIPCYSRGEFLSAMVGSGRALIVAGSHGKSSTAGWVTHALQSAGLPINSYLGAVINKADSSVQFVDSSTPWVLEADESDGSCFLLAASCLILTNIDADHLEAYENSIEVLQNRTVEWIEAMHQDAPVIVCLDDPGVAAILPKISRRVITYGFHPEADYRLLSYIQDRRLAHLIWQEPSGSQHSGTVQLPGKHNAQNALAAWVGAQLFMPGNEAAITSGWSSYPGVKRRMSVHGEYAVSGGEALVIEDYGHHPHAMQVTFDAIRETWPNQRLVVLFQPHRYTRTHVLFDEFVSVLKHADELHLLPIYAAGEQPLDNVSSTHLADAIAKVTHSPRLCADLDAAETALKATLQPGDIFLLLGAGDVGSLSRRFFHHSLSD